MKKSLMTAGLIALAPAFATAAGAPAAAFYALLSTWSTTPGEYAAVTGGATFILDGEGLSYTVQLPGLKRVAGIILLDGTASIPLYSGPGTETESFGTCGSITARNLDGLTVDQLVRDMEQGKVDLVVLTSKATDGSLRARVQRLPAMPDLNHLRV